MAIIDIVKYGGAPDDLVWKFPSTDLRYGTQLVVNTAQAAIFVKGGQILDMFGPGTYTLHTNNLPLLNVVVKLPFGGDSPFQAEVWFINQVAKLDNKWGTPDPILLEDPKYKVIVRARAFGQFGLRVAEPRKMLATLVGTLPNFTSEKIIEYFKGKLISSVSTLISRKMVMDNISILELPAQLEEMSDFCAEKIKDDFTRYGLEILNFFFISINAPNDDPGLQAIEKAKEKAMYVNTVGRDLYNFDSSMDVMKTAAGNDGIAGGMMGGGIGMGMGFGVGNQMGNLTQQLHTRLGDQQNQHIAPPPLPAIFYVLVNGEQQGPMDLPSVGELIKQRTLLKDTYVWKPEMENWDKAISLAELKHFFDLNTATAAGDKIINFKVIIYRESEAG